MYINSEIIKDGITPDVLKRLIERHAEGIDRYVMLKEYYRGKHNILSRTKSSESAANNKVAANWFPFYLSNRPPMKSACRIDMAGTSCIYQVFFTQV